MASIEDEALQTEQRQDGATLVELYDRLDELWARYLTCLDDYNTAQTSIQKHLAAGFFSLTQANFQSPGRRYGRDFYDDRAVAAVRTTVDDGSGLEILKINNERRSGGKDETTKEEIEEAKQLPSPSPTPEPEEKAASDNTADDDTAAEESGGKRPVFIDPIRWFGILTPSSLRSAQQSFASALSDQDVTAKAINAARTMRDVETEIRKLRKAIRKWEKAANAP